MKSTILLFVSICTLLNAQTEKINLESSIQIKVRASARSVSTDKKAMFIVTLKNLSVNAITTQVFYEVPRELEYISSNFKAKYNEKTKPAKNDYTFHEKPKNTLQWKITIAGKSTTKIRVIMRGIHGCSRVNNVFQVSYLGIQKQDNISIRVEH
ncbi:hypothetical protein [Candidatus Uabimicrobium sp. HlEnr_7]|uniref:hypothetical protein n=1 Tax=Candidatus Uabimicrobium helgolandensis TaxID=3095367 RepID=UPI00355732C0